MSKSETLRSFATILDDAQCALIRAVGEFHTASESLPGLVDTIGLCQGEMRAAAEIAEKHEKLEAAVRKMLALEGDDICWRDIYTELAGLVGVEFRPTMLPKPQMLANCSRFIDSLQSGEHYETPNPYREIVEKLGHEPGHDDEIDEAKALEIIRGLEDNEYRRGFWRACHAVIHADRRSNRPESRLLEEIDAIDKADHGRWIERAVSTVVKHQVKTHNPHASLISRLGGDYDRSATEDDAYHFACELENEREGRAAHDICVAVLGKDACVEMAKNAMDGKSASTWRNEMVGMAKVLLAKAVAGRPKADELEAFRKLTF